MKHIYAILIIFIAITSCKKPCTDPANPACENYNPCLNKERVSADFTIEVQLLDKKFEVDSVMTKDVVWFTAKQDLDSFSWFIGGEVLHEKSFYRKSFPAETRIEVMLVGYKTPDKNCFPDDNGVDTVRKSFYVIKEGYAAAPICGYFKGYNTDNPADTFTIKTFAEASSDIVYRLTNLPKGNKVGCTNANVEGSAKVMYNKKTAGAGPYGCFDMIGTAILKNGELTFDYEYNEEEYEAWIAQRPKGEKRIVKKTFKGKKL